MFYLKFLLENIHLNIKNLKNRKREETLIESWKRSMNKSFTSNKQNTTQNLDENITNEQEIHQKYKRKWKGDVTRTWIQKFS